MATLITMKSDKTYSTYENAKKAVERLYSHVTVRYIIVRDNEEGRFYPIFIGEQAVNESIHFSFCVVS